MIEARLIRADALLSAAMVILSLVAAGFGYLSGEGFLVMGSIWVLRAVAGFNCGRHPWMAAIGLVLTALPVLWFVLLLPPGCLLSLTPLTLTIDVFLLISSLYAAVWMIVEGITLLRTRRAHY